ncbi:MAG: rhamnogalacturonan acetylesterase [Paraprevotella sp.]|nr:rhamnogalacturonan acetylesterase [Paraprevotella sp.]
MAQSTTDFTPMEDVNHVTDLTFDSLELANTTRPVPGSSRRGNHPVLFLVGNSTMRTGTKGNGDNGQWGWGYFVHEYFAPDRSPVENHALGGMSSRTFYRKLWPDVKKGIRKGDYVIIELGHNDNGPFDSGRARASIRGISPTDSLCVTIRETGEKETVYSYGEYLRRFVKECKALGACPILLSLTPRNAWDEKNPGHLVRVNETFGLWARQVAEEQDVPFVDLNEISASKFDRFSTWKVDYHFYLDHIHTSEFGARLNARSAAEGLAAATHPALKALQSDLTNLTLPVTNVKREEGKPVVFITGDSTVKNEDKDENGMWGWGSQAASIFDTDKITIDNEAMAGRSTRTYLEEGRWERVYNSIRPGDFVLIQFGHNDISDIDGEKARGVIACAQDTSHVYRIHTGNKNYNEVVYSFGWYLKKFIDDVREKGGTPILVSLTPRNEWPGGKIERRNDTYGQWYRAVVAETAVEFVDLHNITADALDSIGREGAKAYYNHDHTHTSLLGARLNAQDIAKGLRAIDSPLAEYLK